MTILQPKTLANGEGFVLAIEEGIRITIIPDATAVITYSKVDTPDATAHDSNSTQSTSSEVTLDIAWPYYRISVASGTCRVAAF